MKKLYLFALLMCTVFLLQGQDFSNWKYQQVLTIENSLANGVLIDYQLSFEFNSQKLIRAGKMKPDGSDIRIINLRNRQAVCHWIETGLGEPKTKVWLKLGKLGVNEIQQCLLLYGNPEAQAVADPNCVFSMFEDFSEQQLDKKKWEIVGSGNVTIKQGAAHIRAKDTDQLLRTKASYDMPIIAEAFVKKASGKRLNMALIQDDEPLWQGYTMSWEDKYREMYLSSTDAEASPCGGFSYFKDLFGTPARTPEGQWSIAWLTKNRVFAQWPQGQLELGNTLDHFKPLKVAIGVTACSAGLNYEGEMVVDWIRIRKLAMEEPKVFLRGSEKNQISSIENPVQLMG